MSNQKIETKTQIVRAERMGSARSSFYFGLSNRIILPLLIIGLPTAFPFSPVPLICAVIMIFLEFVIRYGMKSTLRDELLGIWGFFFGTKRKRIRN